jgi:phenylpropionate dioxygenase-like ring-hydroxylating dioxygenase large terminal subunit
MAFLRNAWYIAAWSEEISDGRLLARKFLGEPVVLYRDASGRSRALFDRCPHRFAPLSRGKAKGDVIECGYHGLGFNGEGRCVHNPYQPGHAPPRAQVRAYPTLERQGMVWIWMGDADRADPALAPNYPQIEDTVHWHTSHGYLMTPANYLISMDNLMDLTHPMYLHSSSLGSAAMATARYEVRQESARSVNSNRGFEEGPAPPAMDRYFPSQGKPVSHWADMRWEAGSSLMLNTGISWPRQPRDSGLNVYTAHLLAPETETTTHYFFAMIRSAEEVRKFDDAGPLVQIVRDIFMNEDSAMLAAVQERMGGHDLAELKPASLPGDAGATRMREALAKLIEEEKR